MNIFNKKFVRKFVVFILTFLTVLLELFPNNINVSAAAESSSEFLWPQGPSVYADAAIVMEASTGLILYEKDIYTAYYPASITKILTTLLALENCGLQETVTMSHKAEWDVDFNSSRIGMVEGEQFSLEDALYAVMLESANEVSYAVGEHVAKGSISDFAAMMNERAKQLGCVNSNFVNSNGLHDDNHYTCAYDMALISKAAIAIPEFRTIAGSRTHQIPPTNKNVLRYLANHHRFIKKTLIYDSAIGGKTGGTTEAKTTLVTFAERNGLLLIAVVLHVDTALHAYEDTTKMFDFAFENYSLYSMEQSELTDDVTFPSLFSDVAQFKPDSYDIITISENSNVVLPKTANFSDAKKSIELTSVDEFEHGYNIIGQIKYEFGGKYVGAANIYYYNPDYPVTSKEFNAKWPNFLIYPKDFKTDIASVSDNNTQSDSVIKDAKSSPGKSIFRKLILPIAAGIAAGLFILVSQVYIFYIIPHNKRNKKY